MEVRAFVLRGSRPSNHCCFKQLYVTYSHPQRMTENAPIEGRLGYLYLALGKQVLDVANCFDF